MQHAWRYGPRSRAINGLPAQPPQAGEAQEREEAHDVGGGGDEHRRRDGGIDAGRVERHGHQYADQPGYDRVGLASWYGYESSSGHTADGERFDARLATAAHTTLPIPSWLEVTNLQNGRSARLRLNDRGPFVGGRILDVSKAAALELGFYGRGTARVRVRYLGPADLSSVPRIRYAATGRSPVAVAQAVGADGTSADAIAKADLAPDDRAPWVEWALPG